MQYGCGGRGAGEAGEAECGASAGSMEPSRLWAVAMGPHHDHCLIWISTDLPEFYKNSTLFFTVMSVGMKGRAIPHPAVRRRAGGAAQPVTTFLFNVAAKRVNLRDKSVVTAGCDTLQPPTAQATTGTAAFVRKDLRTKPRMP
ncbi:unnamed protein product [Colias eurytheme]|nr:unnamed protein product [Colias eurytheme]